MKFYHYFFILLWLLLLSVSTERNIKKWNWTQENQDLKWKWNATRESRNEKTKRDKVKKKIENGIKIEEPRRKKEKGKINENIPSSFLLKDYFFLSFFFFLRFILASTWKDFNSSYPWLTHLTRIFYFRYFIFSIFAFDIIRWFFFSSTWQESFSHIFSFVYLFLKCLYVCTKNTILSLTRPVFRIKIFFFFIFLFFLSYKFIVLLLSWSFYFFFFWFGWIFRKHRFLCISFTQ